MKLIHLSDLHIGKRVNGFSMLEDQEYIFREILSVVGKEQPDGVILAGDIYDKLVPTSEAVRLFDRFLTGLADRKTAVYAISGNHDSAERIAFGAKLMEGCQVYLSPVYDGTVRRITKKDEYGEVDLYLLPFMKPAVVRKVHPNQEIETYQDALVHVIGQIGADKGRRSVLVAHQFVTGAKRCESEEILVGGMDQVSAELFEAFDYVALGHIHSPQYVKRESIRYSGSPLKYSFSEAGQEKSITVVELKEKGNVTIRTIPLVPLRDMRKVRGTYLEVTARDFYEGTNREDYLQITLTDEEDVPDGLQKLRIFYPNLMQLHYDNVRTRRSQEIMPDEEIREKSEAELFEEFYEVQNNQPMSPAQQDFVRRLIQEIQEKRGEKRT